VDSEEILMSNQYEVLTPNEVLTLKKGSQLLLEQSTFKVAELLQCMKDELHGHPATKGPWFVQGMECEVLSPNKDWRKGKVRVCIAFIDDAPETIESPLDSIRQTSVNQAVGALDE
jgi:hypothetical protein